MARQKRPSSVNLFFLSSSSSTAFLLLLSLLLCIAVEQVTTAGYSDLGSCWRLRKKDGSCGQIQRRLVTRERCCSSVRRRGWSSQAYFNISSDSISSTSNSVISDQATCSPCSMLCDGVKCGEDQKCVVRCGIPRCVCSPQCHLKHKEPVCGSDGRTYSSECHLLKRACRKKKRVLVAHYGPCQTCHGVRCRGGKKCVLDEQMTPKCIRCPSSCPTTDKRPLCAADGYTYRSRCELKRASCRASSLIPRAYMGSCRRSPTCDSVRCWGNQTCLTNVETGRPQCTECNDHSCRPSSRAVCASDGRTYPSWCAFRHEACRSGRALTPALHLHCANNHTQADDCKPFKNTGGGGGGSDGGSRRARKHRNRQQELEETQKERQLLQHQTLMKEVHQAQRLTAVGQHHHHDVIPDLEEDEVSTMAIDGGGGGSGQVSPEEANSRNKRKRSRRRRKKCEKSRKRRRKTPKKIVAGP